MVRFEVAPRSILAVFLLIACVWFLIRLLPVLLVLIAALMLVGTFSPIVAYLERRKVNRKVGIGIVFGTGFAVCALVLSFVVPSLMAQFKTLIEQEPEIRGRVADYLAESRLTAALADELRNVHYGELLKSSNAVVLTVTTHAIAIMAYGAGAVFLALYMLIDRDRLRGGLFAVIPRKHHIRFSRVLLNLESIVGGYIRGQVMTCVLMSVFILVLLLICRVPNAMAIAVFGGVADVLPYIGAFLTMGPAVAAAYSVTPAIGLTVFLLLLGYEEFESRVLVPVVYGRALRLPSSLVFFALLVGAALGGVVGALLALPMAAAALMLIDELRVDLPGETIQPEDVKVRLKDEREEQEYEDRTDTAPVEEAAAVAVEIARERKEEEEREKVANEERKEKAEEKDKKEAVEKEDEERKKKELGAVP